MVKLFISSVQREFERERREIAEYIRQDEDFMVTLWRKEGSGTVQSAPEVIQSDPERSKTDPNIVEQVYQLIVKDHSISRARK